MPIGVQRDLKQAWSNPDTFGGDASAKVAFGKLMDLLRRAHAKGIFIVTGTDTGGSLTYHRELELLVKAGFTPAEALARATLEMARYLGIDQTTGSVERGKLADFFLIPGDPTSRRSRPYRWSPRTACSICRPRCIRVSVSNRSSPYPRSPDPARTDCAQHC